MGKGVRRDLPARHRLPPLCRQRHTYTAFQFTEWDCLGLRPARVAAVIQQLKCVKGDGDQAESSHMHRLTEIDA